jgi:putative endonuclease
MLMVFHFLKVFFMYTVYMLYSKKLNKYYTGETQDLSNRLLEHNAGETKSLMGGIPWELVWSATVATRTEAVQLELKTKGNPERIFIGLNKYSSL